MDLGTHCDAMQYGIWDVFYWDPKARFSERRDPFRRWLWTPGHEGTDRRRPVEQHAERAGRSVPHLGGAGGGYVSRRVAAGDKATRSRSAPTRARLISLGKIVGLVDQVIRVLHDLISARE